MRALLVSSRLPPPSPCEQSGGGGGREGRGGEEGGGAGGYPSPCPRQERGKTREENREKKGRESEKELVRDAECVMTKGRTIK